MKHLSQAMVEYLAEHHIQAIYKEGVHFGDDYSIGTHHKFPGKYEGYYFRYKGRHVLAVGDVNGVMLVEPMMGHDKHGNFIFADIYPVETLDDVVEAALAAAAVIRMNSVNEEA